MVRIATVGSSHFAFLLIEPPNLGTRIAVPQLQRLQFIERGAKTCSSHPEIDFGAVNTKLGRVRGKELFRLRLYRREPGVDSVLQE